MKDGRGRAIAVAVLMAVLGACSADGEQDPAIPSQVASSQPTSTTEGVTPSPMPGPTMAPFPDRAEPVAFEAGTYLMPSSSSSVADFTVTFPEGWMVQYGEWFSKHPHTDGEVGFYAALVDTVFADACAGSQGELIDIEVGPSVDDLASALLEQQGPKARGPFETTLSGYPAIRVDLTVPKTLDLKPCNVPGALQLWLSQPDDYTVLSPEDDASVYIVDVDGQRQVFFTRTRSATSGEDRRELQAVLDSIRIPSLNVGEDVLDPTPDDGEAKVRGWPDTTKNNPGVYSWDGYRCRGPRLAEHSCGNVGFMHNGYGSGDVEIRVEQVPEGGITDGATATTVAGHDGIHRRIDPRNEWWIVDIEGTTIAIYLAARPGASQADLAEAHAIIGSMRTEPRDNVLGFRLVFTLTTDDWDSG